MTIADALTGVLRALEPITLTPAANTAEFHAQNIAQICQYRAAATALELALVAARAGVTGPRPEYVRSE